MTPNTYAKYCPNVYVAKCIKPHEKGSTIMVQNKYGKDNASVVFNLVAERGGFFYYSIVRADGMNVQQWAKQRAERLAGWAANAQQRGENCQLAASEGRDFLALGEPIKVGHHSEKRHRALIERNHNRMERAMSEYDKADGYAARAEYWQGKTEVINLSMPDSLEYYQFKLEEAQARHQGMKKGTVEREHSMSLQYASKAVKDLTKQVETARILWG